MSMIHALCLEPPMAEEKFLAQELNVRWITSTEEEIEHSLRSQRTTLLIVSDPRLYTRLLEQAPGRSAVVIQISDEAYTRDRVAQAAIPSVRKIFRHYAPVAAPVTQRLSAVAGFVRDASGSSIKARSARPLFESGTQVRRRMLTWHRVTIPVPALPLGYTNAFANQITHDQQSDSKRGTSICFRGNRGLAPRILGLEAAAQVPGADIQLVDQVWSGASTDGASARDYVDQLQDSRFALVPPGFVNAETFRYYEALLCGALPVEIAVALTHLGRVPFRSHASIRAWSWKEAMRQVQHMSEDERVARVSAARTLMEEHFISARAELAKAVEE